MEETRSEGENEATRNDGGTILQSWRWQKLTGESYPVIMATIRNALSQGFFSLLPWRSTIGPQRREIRAGRKTVISERVSPG